MYEQNDELMHHGVLGMKWGVRRFQNKDGSLTAAGKKRVQNAEQSDEKLLITNDGYTLKKGTKVQRISTVRENDVRPYAYVSFTKHDNKHYNKNFTENLEFADPNSSIYKNTLVTIKDLKIPSRDTSKRIFVELYQERSKEFVETMANNRRITDINYQPLESIKLVKTKYNGDNRKAYEGEKKRYIDRYSKMTVKQLQDDAYYDFVHSIGQYGDVNKKMRDMYFDKLKSEGYNAVIDDNDSVGGLGVRGYSKETIPNYPLIILDASENLKKSRSSVVKRGNKSR